MMSSPTTGRSRLDPAMRREQIVAEAAEIALTEGLERITLRAVAERLGVRAGLITHYFPAAEELVVTAFERAASTERDTLFRLGGTARRRLVRFLAEVSDDRSRNLARLWLNARHLARFSPALALALEQQEAEERDLLLLLLEEGIAGGDLPPVDAAAAGIRILVAVDGAGAYANDITDFTDDTFTHVVSDIAEWALGMPAGSLRRH